MDDSKIKYDLCDFLIFEPCVKQLLTAFNILEALVETCKI
jgi:hypothetical protein